MSKDLARGSESYANERLAMALAPAVLHAKGFQAVRVLRRGGMKLVETTRVDGTPVVFWLKQAWSTTSTYSAIQFGMLPADPRPKTLPDASFVDFVADRVEAARERGATHALLIHLFEEHIQSYVALDLGDLARAYARQIGLSPARARNTKTPTLYFGDVRAGTDPALIRAVTDLEIRLEDLSGLSAEAGADRDGPGSKRLPRRSSAGFSRKPSASAWGNDTDGGAWSQESPSRRCWTQPTSPAGIGDSTTRQPTESSCE